MDIKLILENQLAIMRWLISPRQFDNDTALNQQIEKTLKRIEQWEVQS